MKRPISVTAAGLIYLVITALSVFTFVAFAVYGGEELIQAMAENFPFLPPLLSMIVSLVFTVLPVFVAVGIFSGKPIGRWLAVFLAAVSVLIPLTDLETFGTAKLLIQIGMHTVILVCLFNPAANRYFARDKNVV